jgi:hypothetical protein
MPSEQPSTRAFWRWMFWLFVANLTAIYLLHLFANNPNI